MTITEAFATSTPTSTTVVQTSTSTWPVRNASITASFSSCLSRPWSSCTRRCGQRACSSSAPRVASARSIFSEASTSGYSTYAWRPFLSSSSTASHTSGWRDGVATRVVIGVRPGGSSSSTDRSRSP